MICSGGIGYYALEDYDPDDVSLNRVDFASPAEARDLIKLDSDGNYVDSVYIATAASYAEQYEPNDIVFYDGNDLYQVVLLLHGFLLNGYVAQFDTDLAFISKAYSVNKTWENPNPSTAESFTPYQMDVNSNDGTVYLAGAQVYAKTLPMLSIMRMSLQLPALPFSVSLATHRPPATAIISFRATAIIQSQSTIRHSRVRRCIQTAEYLPLLFDGRERDR